MTPVLKLPKNDKGRDFIVADIHGCYEQLEKALDAAGFDPDKDRLIAIGDLVDRGPSSVECLYYLSQPWFHAIRGNHEDIICRIVRDDGSLDESIFKTGMPHFIEWIRAESPETRIDLKEAFDKLPRIIEIETPRGMTGLVHADVPEGMDWKTFRDAIEDMDNKVVRISAWSRRRLDNNDESGVDGIDRVFFGHSPVEGGPKKLGNCFFSDTGGVFRIMNESTQDFYIALIDLAASDDEILAPDKTNDAFVRIVTAKGAKPAPKITPKPPTP